MQGFILQVKTLLQQASLRLLVSFLFIPQVIILGIVLLTIIITSESDFAAQFHVKKALAVLLFFGAVTFVTFSSLIMARFVSRPLQALNEAAQEIAKGDLEQTVTVNSVREVQELATSFNQMSAQLQNSFAQMQALNQALAENESRLHQFLEALPVGVSVHDPRGQLTYVNRVGQNLLGIAHPLDITLEQLAEAYQMYDCRTQLPYKTEDLPVTRALAGEAVHTDGLEIHHNEQVIPVELWTTSVVDENKQVVYAITAFQDIRDRKQAETKLNYNALHDALTNLPNRNLLMEQLKLTINRAKRQEDYQFAVLFLDLDRFKVINDSLGHLVGDELLIAVAKKLQNVIRANDIAARLGGDEFVLLLDDIEGIEEATQVGERIFDQLRSPFNFAGHNILVTTSIGIVLGTKDYNSASDLLRDADIAMYRAKEKGKAQYEIFDLQMQIQAKERLHLENDLRQAFERQEFVIYYQPIVSLKTGYLYGFEALVRWQHPTKGILHPAQFIHVAEEIGLITLLDDWVLQEACRQVAFWQQYFQDLQTLKIGVNLSVQEIDNPILLRRVEEILHRTGLESNCLSLEIIESALDKPTVASSHLLLQLKARGVQISIDGFGNGYMSLDYLHSVPVNILKINRSFIAEIDDDNKSKQIIKTIMTLSHQLKLKTIATGVETYRQLEQLRGLGCELGQGHYFSQPLTPEAVENLLTHQRVWEKVKKAGLKTLY